MVMVNDCRSDVSTVNISDSEKNKLPSAFSVDCSTAHVPVLSVAD